MTETSTPPQPDRVLAFLKEAIGARTSYQLYVATEAYANSAPPDDRVTAMHGVIAQDLTELGQFLNDEAMKPWFLDYEKCESFLPAPKLASSSFPGVAAFYVIDMGKDRAEALPANYDSFQNQMRLNQAAACLRHMRILHAKLRVELRRRGFIAPIISSGDPEKDRAEQEVRGTRVR